MDIIIILKGVKKMSERIARLTKDFHYLEIAKAVSKRSTCINKQFGAVIVQHDRIVSTGYNGSPMKCINCSDVGRCRRLEDPNYKRGVTSYDMTCPAVHSEINAMLAVGRDQMLGATMYLYGWDVINNQVVPNVNSCPGCRRAILNSGIVKLVVADNEHGIVSNDPDIPYRVRIINVDDWRKDEAALFSGY
jgi:dCMP deaminase